MDNIYGRQIWFKKHTALPAELVFFKFANGTRSIMLTHPWPDLQHRINVYIDDWNRDFPDNKIQLEKIEQAE